MDDEREAVEAIYGEDFEARPHPRDGCPCWRIQLPDPRCRLALKFPKEGYPEREAPTLALEFDAWPAGADAFTARMSQELRELFAPGDGCVYEWVEHVKEALAAGPPELAAGGDTAAPPGAALETGGGDSTDAKPEPGVGVAALRPDAVDAVASSLLQAGFSSYGSGDSGVYSHGKHGITVELANLELTITVDRIDAEDLSDWAEMQLQEHGSAFGERLCVWVAAQREEGFAPEEGGAADGGLDFLPSPEELGVDRSRPLLIYTWGKALRKAAPPDSGCNFNAGILNGRGGGADLRTMNGLSEEVQNNVASCGLFPRWITMVCHKVEHSNLDCISINCTKGRHRSVAAAEILKQVYSPQATTKHLTIY